MPRAMSALEFALAAPKAELHLHIEGTLEPELAFALAQKNGITLPFANVEELRHAYNFRDLQGFLDLYYGCAAVLCTESDFAELAYAYLARAKQAGIVHADLSFDPQTHLVRGISMDTVINGLLAGCKRARDEFGISTSLVMCFLRHLSAEDGLAALEAAKPYLDKIAGFGLDSGEQGNPPSKFVQVYEACRAMGKKLTAHAGEEGPASNITEALDLLHCCRIDHGVRAVEDPTVVARLAREQIPLTVCPLSNVRLCVFKDLAEHTLPQLLAANCKVTINSDDPAYLGGYLDDSIRACHTTFGWDVGIWARLFKNSIEAAWVEEEAKRPWLEKLEKLQAEAENNTV